MIFLFEYFPRQICVTFASKKFFFLVGNQYNLYLEKTHLKTHALEIGSWQNHRQVTYGRHTSTYECHTDDIQVHTKDIRVHTSDIRMT